MSGQGGEAEPIKRVVLDTTVLSNYAASDSLWLIVETFSEPITVTSVRSEVFHGIRKGRPYLKRVISCLSSDSGTRDDSKIHVTPDSVTTPPKDIAQLDRGESGALDIARFDGYALATDDMDAREVAREYDVPVTGSLGILVRGIERDEITLEEAEDWHDIWIRENGYYSPVDSVSELL